MGPLPQNPNPQNQQPYEDRNRAGSFRNSNDPQLEQQRDDYNRNRQNFLPNDVDDRRDGSGSYRNANPPPPVGPPPPNIPYTSPNSNYPSENYPKNIPNYTKYSSSPTDQRRNYEDPRRNPNNYQDGRSTNWNSGNYGGNTQGNPYRGQAQGQPGYPNEISQRNYQSPQQQPGSNYYPATGSAAYPGPVGGGASRNWNYPGGRGSFDPGDPHRNIWNEPWSTTTNRPIAPGVLGGWRPDLQGKQRQDDFHKIPETVFVQTSYGRVQVNGDRCKGSLPRFLEEILGFLMRKFFFFFF